MQLPLEWYVYIIPGSLFLLSVILLLPNKILGIFKGKGSLKDQSLLVLPITIIFSFLIGLAADNLIHIVASEPSVSLEKELLIKHKVDPVLIQEMDSRYTRMAFSRLLWISSAVLAIVGVIRIVLTNEKYITSIRKVFLVILILLLVILLINQWCVNKQSFKEAKALFKKEIINTLQNDTIKKDSFNLIQLPQK
jgi:uncharacterized membrane protein